MNPLLKTIRRWFRLDIPCLSTIYHYLGMLCFWVICVVAFDVFIISVYAWHAGHLADFLHGLIAWIQGEPYKLRR